MLIWRERVICSHPYNIIIRNRFQSGVFLAWSDILGSRTYCRIVEGGSVTDCLLLPFLKCIILEVLWVLNSFSWMTALQHILQWLSMSWWRVQILSVWIALKSPGSKFGCTFVELFGVMRGSTSSATNNDSTATLGSTQGIVCDG